MFDCVKSLPISFVMVCAVANLASVRAAEPSTKAGRLNILWITCEDTSPDLGCYGDKYASTPNLDALAAQGIRFSNAFSVAGVCAPSRSAIITGMYPTAIGTMHMRSKGVPPAFVKCFPEYLRAAGYYCTNNVKTDYNFDAPITAWDDCSKNAHWRNRAAGQPFFAVFNITTTHESQIRCEPEQFAKHMAAVPVERRHDPLKAVLPPYYPDTPAVRNDWARYYDLVTAMDLQAADLLAQLETDGLADSTIVFFYGDHGRGLPRAKRWLYDSGMRVPLIVRWPDHREAGTVCDDLVSFVDLAPTVLSLAGVEIPAYMQGQAFLGKAKAEKPREYVFGARDRMDETYDIIRAVRDKQYKYIRNFKPGRPYAQYIDYGEKMPTMQEMRRLNKSGELVGPQKLFFAAEKPAEELYDTKADPHEINNLAISRPMPVDGMRPAELGKVLDGKIALDRMRAAMDEWIKQTGDLGMIPEEELKEGVRPGGKWATTARPEVSPEPGSFEKPVRVTVSCATEGASIAYTTETGRKAAWKLYTGPVAVDATTTLRIKAIRLGYKESEELQAKYTIGR